MYVCIYIYMHTHTGAALTGSEKGPKKRGLNPKP